VDPSFRLPRVTDRRIERTLGDRFIRTTEGDEFGHLCLALPTWQPMWLPRGGIPEATPVFVLGGATS
jgi:hypothetical protein